MYTGPYIPPRGGYEFFKYEMQLAREEGREEGYEAGLEEGRRIELPILIREMKSNGTPISAIAKATGWTIEQIEELK